MIKVAVLWIVNDEGEIMLAQRAHHKAHDPGVWGPAAGGRLEKGENFNDALLREVEEEISVKPADYTPHFLFEKHFNHPDGEERVFGIYYAVLPKAKARLIHIDANEVAGFAWFPLAALEEKLRSSPEELVPSAPSIWPEVFGALRDAEVI